MEILFIAALVLLLVVVPLLLALIIFGSTMLLVFTAFVHELPIWLKAVLFILFPPALVVYLVGLFIVRSGYVEKWTKHPDPVSVESGPRVDAKTRKLVTEKRRLMGYDS